MLSYQQLLIKSRSLFGKLWELHWIDTSPSSALWLWHGPLARQVNLRVAHAPGMSGTFSPPQLVSNPDMHHDTCVTHVPWCMPGSLTSGFIWSWWRGKRSLHSRRVRNPQFYVSGKRSMALISPSWSAIWSRLFCDDITRSPLYIY